MEPEDREFAGLADCHLHFEGSLPGDVVESLARRAGSPLGEPGALSARRAAVRDSAGFLAFFADVCRLFRSPGDYADAAAHLSAALAADGVAYAEVYVSPEICERIGVDPRAALQAVDAGFAAAARNGCDCRILLDTVRHWGPEAAGRVLDLHESLRLERVVGFGMGGDESAFPAAAFAGPYARARALGLKTSIHAGEWVGAESVRDALDALRPDRIDHGIGAADDPELLERLAEERVPLFVAPTGNVATGAVASFAEHPLPRLVASGVAVALSADDPLLFSTSTSAEYRAAAAMGIGESALLSMARLGWTSAFGLSPAEQKRGAAGVRPGFEPSRR
ncbi:MAG: adenosine deaminase [Acidobacteriota bacterium]